MVGRIPNINMIKNPDNFKCPWCGNTVLAMTWEEIRDMLISFREVVGVHAFKQIEEATGITVVKLRQYAVLNIVPSYETGRILAIYLREAFKEIPQEKINEFQTLYPHIQ